MRRSAGALSRFEQHNFKGGAAKKICLNTEAGQKRDSVKALCR